MVGVSLGVGVVEAVLVVVGVGVLDTSGAEVRVGVGVAVGSKVLVGVGVGVTQFIARVKGEIGQVPVGEIISCEAKSSTSTLIPPSNSALVAVLGVTPPMSAVKLKVFPTWEPPADVNTTNKLFAI